MHGRNTAGDLFVALNTGTRFVEAVLARGAATLVPRNQEAALAALARLVRDRSSAEVVAVVGSTGKTTTKDALGALCAAVTPTVAAAASKNNELGLPLTVLRLEEDTRVLVTEMGMRGLGQIASLAAVSRPAVGVITNVGPAHLELVGSLEAVAGAKGELLAALPPGGTAVVPEDFRVDRDDIEVVRRGQPDAVSEDGSREAWLTSFDCGATTTYANSVKVRVPEHWFSQEVLTAICALPEPATRRSGGRATTWL